MGLPRMKSPRSATSRRLALCSALAMGVILPSVGCQVEYAGMTLPSGKYMHDDVQYFSSGPEYPFANTQAATQRSRMRAMGYEPSPTAAPGPQRAAEGAINARQNQMGRFTDVNSGAFGADPDLGEVPQAPAPGLAPEINAQPNNVPPPPPPGGDHDNE